MSDMFLFKDFLSNLLLKIVIYCVTYQLSITQSQRSVINFKICPKFQVPSFHFSEVDDLLNEHWVRNLQRENILLCSSVEQGMAVKWFNRILKICSKFQVLNPRFSEVNELLNRHWAKNMQSENSSTLIYVQCRDMYWSKCCGQEFWCILSDLNILVKWKPRQFPYSSNFLCLLYQRLFLTPDKSLDLFGGTT